MTANFFASDTAMYIHPVFSTKPSKPGTKNHISIKHMKNLSHSWPNKKKIASIIKHLLILFYIDTNYIFPEPIPNRIKRSIKYAYAKILRINKNRGLKPQLHRLENEASNILNKFTIEKHIDFQLTPAGIHWRNWVERAIQTSKNNFIAGLWSTDPRFPLNLWCKLVTQYVLTLNFLRNSWINTKLSAHEQVFGNFNYDCTTMAPPGIKVLIRECTKDHGSWSTHALSGWYIDPSFEHYHCHKIWIPSTNAVRIQQTVSWFTQKLIMPTTTNTYIIISTVKYWTASFKQINKNPLLAPSDTITRKALFQLDSIFYNAYSVLK